MRLSRSNTTLLLGRLHGTSGIAHLGFHWIQSYSEFCSNCALASHSLRWHSGHTSVGRSSSPISTTSSLYLPIQKERGTQLLEKRAIINSTAYRKNGEIIIFFLKKNGDGVPLTRINPPNTIKISSMNAPKTFAMIMFLAAPPTNRKSDAAI